MLQTQNGVCRICSTHQSAPQTLAVSSQVATNTPVRQVPVSLAPHNHRAAPPAPGLNPHSARGTTCDHLRDFVPWRFSDAGPTHAWLDLHSGVRETCTQPDSCTAAKRIAIGKVRPFSSIHFGGAHRVVDVAGAARSSANIVPEVAAKTYRRTDTTSTNG
jgi:hypothetical protein